MRSSFGFLSDAQLQSELDRCVYCEDKPCQRACPADCSPADFIMAASGGAPADFRRSAAMILGANPLGGVCGAVCPDSFCQQACSRRLFDRPIEIPAVQAAIVAKAKQFGLREFASGKPNGKSIAVIGAGPAGLGAASVLAQRGYQVMVFDRRPHAGGMADLIPAFRLPKEILRTDIAFVRQCGAISFQFGVAVDSAERLLATHHAVVVCAGLTETIPLGIPGEEAVISWSAFLGGRSPGSVAGKKVAIIGGGAVAADCATTAVRRGAHVTELIYRRRAEDMPVTAYERRLLLGHGVQLSTCVRPLEVVTTPGRIKGLKLARLTLPRGKRPLPANFTVNERESPIFREFDVIISAIGNRPAQLPKPTTGIFHAGDLVLGSSTVVEAVASGKNAALAADAFVRKIAPPIIGRSAKSHVVLAGAGRLPVALDADFFGRRILSPLLLSAAPHTDGYDQMRAAYVRGWAGGVMKTAFDGGPIHIPGDYMFVLGRATYGNCDNVSGHALDRVGREVERLVREFPDRLTLASTGGPVTGRDEADRAAWQANTRKLERAGAMGIEYSLSCPQGGDGTQGDVVSQNAALTAKIIGWVLESGDARVPKLFKLTGAVTAIGPIIAAIREVFDRFPQKPAGVTLANSFPSLAFRPSPGRAWDEGVVIGMSGDGVRPISNLTLAKAAGLGLTISGNGGAMSYRDAANFLALGCGTVQFCTAVMKYGLGYVDELNSGLSHLLEERGLASVGALIGAARPEPITDFNALSAVKRLPAVEVARCQQCGNCTRCPYQAVTLNRHGVPRFNAARCVGCSLCVQQCFAGALVMRERTAAERAAFVEH